VNRLLTDEGAAAGGAPGTGTGTGLIPVAYRAAGRASVPVIVSYRQEVRPMNAASAVGAPLPSTIARLR
jgi:hypothetical protein